ncbi:MAG: Gfo/Idh/MocA family oxidoreductase [Pseudomonadota bacterium]
MLNYAIVGAGMMGQEHIRNLALLEGVEVAALAEPNADMMERSSALAPGAKRYADHRDLLSDGGFDAVVIASPNQTHSDILLDVFAAGKPVLCEKPLATSSDECRKIERAAAKYGSPLWVAMEYRYMPPIARLLELSHAAIAGKPQMIAIREHRFPFLEKVNDWNRFNSNTGGTFVEKCCHFFDLMHLITGSDAVRVYASAGQAVNHLDERYDGKVPDILDHGFVVVDFENGSRAMLDLCMFAEGSHYQEEISITGANGKIEAFVPGPGRFLRDGHDGAGLVVVSPRETQTPKHEKIEIEQRLLAAGDHNGATYYQHEKFRDVVLGNARIEVCVADGARAVRMGEAAEISAKTGFPVQLQ